MDEIREKFGRSVRLTPERRAHIERRKEMVGQRAKIRETLTEPDVVRRSRHDPAVYLYYKHFGETPVSEKYLLVVAKVEVESPFVITAFFTDTIKAGEQLWPKPKREASNS